MQRTLYFGHLELGSVNRAQGVRITASGKVVNAARVITSLKGQCLLATFLGGDPGRFIARELDAGGIPHEVVWVEDDTPTRTCATLLSDDGSVTELVEDAPPVSEKDVAALEEIVTRHLEEAGALCLIGSFPPGVPDDFYGRLTAAAHSADVPVLVDAQGAPMRAALSERPFLVKPNLEEAVATLHLPTSSNGKSDTRAAVSALTDAGARWALVSEGASGSLLGDSSDNLWRVEPPQVEVVNPIGSGDSMAAGLLLALRRGASVPDAAVYGTACAAANVLTPTSGVVRPTDVDLLYPRVRLSKLS
jgi:1-phosphofructokinase family hexose kinase